MKPKKYRKHNINENCSIYFTIGLIIVLSMTYIALEWKTYDQHNDWDVSLSLQDDIIEDVPVTVHPIKTPPPKIQSAPFIEIAPDDDIDIIESLIESTESDINTEVVSIDSIVSIDLPEDEEIPFFAIEEVPLFPGCENSADKRACFQEMIHDHVKRNFQYPQSAVQMGLQGRVHMMFVIRKDGSIGEIRMRGPHQILEKEAERIISKLPKFTPGKQRGEAVKVSFTLPVVFKLQ